MAIRPSFFLGDSITQYGKYTTLVETYTLTRFPDWKITFRNAGWAGDTAWFSQRGADFDTALQRDVLALHPKAVTIDFGMNDARTGDDGYPKYIEYMTKQVDELKKSGARVALMTPSPEEKYDPASPGGSPYNVMLKKYSDGLKDLAAKENIPFVDQLTPFIAVIDAGRKAGVLNSAAPPPLPEPVPGAPKVPPTTPAGYIRLNRADGVHPEWPGGMVMATTILTALHGPALVSAASLDAGTRTTVAAQDCTIEWQDAPTGAVQFKRTDKALPWPTPPDIDVTLKIPGFDPAGTLNRYELKVANLKAPSYKLTIDGKDIGTYASTDLAAGVNLGFVRQGPIYDQGQQLFKTVTDKNDAYFTRWRKLQVKAIPEKRKNDPAFMQDRQTQMATLDKQIADDEATIETLRKPVPHVFKLEPVK